MKWKEFPRDVIFMKSFSGLWTLTALESNHNVWHMKFDIILLAILNHVIWSVKSCSKSLVLKEDIKEICLNFIVSTVLADGLAPLGARPSAGTVMMEFRSHVFSILYDGTGNWNVNIGMGSEMCLALISFWSSFNSFWYVYVVRVQYQLVLKYHWPTKLTNLPLPEWIYYIPISLLYRNQHQGTSYYYE